MRSAEEIIGDVEIKGVCCDVKWAHVKKLIQIAQREGWEKGREDAVRVASAVCAVRISALQFPEEK